MRDPYVASMDDYVSAIGPALRLALPATAIRNRSLDARRLLTRAAIGSAGTLDDLLEAARAGNRRWLRRIRRRVDAGVLAALAQTLALQDMLPDDRRDALAIYELIRSALGPSALTPANQGLHAQLAAAAPDRVRELLTEYRSMTEVIRTGLEIDLINPFGTTLPVEPWLTAFRALLPEPWPTMAEADAGVNEPVPFDRLGSAEAPERIDAPQRVSVVVTAYRPGESLITAVRSIVAQTWSNVEVIIVDDASPPEFESVLTRAEALGDRIRLVRLGTNGGTYAARNAGLDAAGGEFVAFQDSDDWSHPRRLELQVAPLLANRRLVATTSDGISVTDDLRLTRVGVRSGRLNPSSLLFRRTVVTGRAGYFDRVRKAADSEYIGRIQAAFGPRSVQHVDVPLALIRLSVNSLSRSEIKAHWMHPARVAYSSAYLCWHRQIARGAAKAYRPADGSGRPFAVPAHLLGSPARSSYDVIVVADWRFLEGTQLSAVDEVRVLADAGMRVAIAQLESYRIVHLKRVPLCTPIQQLVNSGRIDQVLIGDRVDATLLIVRQAAVLQFAGGEQCGIRASRAIVVADRAPVRGDGLEHGYTPSAGTAAMLRLFEVDPLWCPQDAGVRAALRTADPALSLTSTDLAAVVDGREWAAPRTGVADRSIVGTDLCDAGTRPADIPDLVAPYRRLVDADVRLRLPDRPNCTVELPRSWLTFAAADLGARAFLHQLDFYLHFPHRQAVEVHAQPALAAAALGCVLLLPERYASRYGDAAVYCEPEDVAGLIRRYTVSPALYAEQSRKARETVARAHHPDRFVEQIAALMRPVIAPSQRSHGDGEGHNVIDEVTSHGGKG